LTRCRIAHSILTHSYLLNKEERPECIPCNSNYSLKHGLTDCVDVADVQQTFYNVNNLSNSSYKCRRRYTFEILKEIDLYTKHIVR
jgi:transposase-like protein